MVNRRELIFLERINQSISLRKSCEYIPHELLSKIQRKMGAGQG